MTEANRCDECGSELAADSPQGLCPGCLLKRGLETNTFASGGDASASADYVPPTPAELAAYFPDLEILELVGRGGMGVVYKARQKRLDRFVALKILSPKIGNDPAFAERFQREAKAMAILSHPHIVTVHDFGCTGSESVLYYFIMEFIDGVNLRRLLDTQKLSPEEALAIVPQICDALQYAHDHGVVHRDIKPENILIDKNGRVKIADFGLAKLVGRESKDFTLTGAGQIMGTPHYMAPEQFEHPKDVDHRADIYSLGVVFYQMLTGELPIGRFAPPSQRVHIDVRLDEIVLRALEKEPTLRYQHVSEMKTQVETIATAPSPPAPRGSGFGLVVKRNGERAINWRAFIIISLIMTGGVLVSSTIATLLLMPERFRDKVPYNTMAAIALSLVVVLSWLYRAFKTPLEQLQSLDEPGTQGPNAGQTKRAGEAASAIDAGVPQAPGVVVPRFSRTAIFGAACSPLFLVFCLSVLTFSRPVVSQGEYVSPPWSLVILGIALTVLGAAAPFATTILGGIAISQIRHSAGRLYGLGLAVFDVLLFPLLALDVLIGCLISVAIAAIIHTVGVNDKTATVLVLLLLTLFVSAVVDFFIVRWAWRAANQPLDASSGSSSHDGSRAAHAGAPNAPAEPSLADAPGTRPASPSRQTLFGIPLDERQNGIPQIISWPGLIKVFAVCLVCGLAAILLSPPASHGYDVSTPLIAAILLLAIIVDGCAWIAIKHWRTAGNNSTRPPSTTAPADDAATEQARRQLHGPAVGLLVAGILNWVLSVPLLMFIRWLEAGFGSDAPRAECCTATSPRPSSPASQSPS